jgi:sugar phosphate isomerase/epimerase
MIKSCVTIALVPQIKTGPWIFWNDLEKSMAKAADLGFDAIELFTSAADAVDVTTLSNLLIKYNLKLAAVGTGAGKVLHGLTLTDVNQDVRAKAVSFITDMISFGAKFGAPAIIGSMQGNIVAGIERNQVMDWFSEGLITLDKHAQLNGVKLIYEPLNRYETNLINTIADGAAYLTALQTTNITLLADLFHMNIEETDIAESINKFSTFIGHVHFADSNRRPIGNGHTEMGKIAQALKDSKYNGFISAEAFPWPDEDTAAKQTITSFNKYFRN